MGLAGYHRKFIHHSDQIVAPLTELLKKDGSSGIMKLKKLLKTALTTTPVLALPDFNQPLITECDALGTGAGAVLI